MSGKSKIEVEKVDKPQLAKHDSKNLDLAFAMDCTGSMGSYIYEAKNNIRKIVEEIVASEKSDVRLALVEYRDHPPQDSTFVTRCHDFTPSSKTMKGWLSDCSATGGGDTPEAVADALHDLLKLSWREEATKICVCISDAPPHGLGCGGDGFPNGCPDGIDPMVVAHQLAKKGITIYIAGCEPSISPYKDFFMAVAYITGGQYVPMRKAQVLSKVIIGGAQEELSLNQLMAEVDAEVQNRVQAGEDFNEEEVSDLMHERWRSRGECVAQLQMNKAELGTVLSSPEAKTYSKFKSLSEVRTNFKAKPTLSTRSSCDAAEYSLKPATKGSGGGILNWIGSWFGGYTESGDKAEPESIPRGIPSDDEYETVKTEVTIAQSSRLVKKAMAKHKK
ncbi:uncharacterized protein LOC123533890 [Mercenaria mercenaria]|uniref:uncharacterized protein LOC123533890 n=1 Tax=Mercenaria mercenaria TaxID=6596 RepID=UPI00234FAE7B|nr:uncharacterized protein LOC123533890 [Mercenaria mercenaria]